jgi:DNA repair ATPase RecN
MNELEEAIGVKSRLELIRSELDRRTGRKEILEESLRVNKTKIEDNLKSKDLFSRTVILLQHASEVAREKMKNHFEEIVTLALKSVYDKNMSFEIEFTIERGNVNAEFYVKTKFQDVEIKVPPIETKGGGVVDIVCFALRIAMLELYQPREDVAGAVVLDEPFKWLDSSRDTRAAEFLSMLTKKLNRQLIINTHQTVLASYADKHFHLELTGDRTRVNTIVGEKDLVSVE